MALETEDSKRSLHAIQKVYLRFENYTDRDVEIIWINYFGEYITYRILKSKDFFDINTYKSHPWLAVDAETKDRLHLDKKFIYMPQTWQETMKEKFPNLNNIPNVERRISIKVTLPLYSLKYGTLLVVRNLLKVVDDIDKLELPNQLGYILKKCYEEKVNFLSPD